MRERHSEPAERSPGEWNIKGAMEDCACLCAFELRALLFLVNVLEEGMAGVSTDRST